MAQDNPRRGRCPRWACFSTVSQPAAACSTRRAKWLVLARSQAPGCRRTHCRRRPGFADGLAGDRHDLGVVQKPFEDRCGGGNVNQVFVILTAHCCTVGQIVNAHTARPKLLTNGDGWQKSPSISLFLDQVLDSVANNPRKSLQEVGFAIVAAANVVAAKQGAGQQLHHDVVRFLLYFPLVAVACIPQTLGDVP